MRPATLEDLPALTALQRQWDTHWFGAPENDEAEVRDSLELVPSLETHSRLILAGDALLAAAWVGASPSVLIDTTVDPGPLYADLLPWLASFGRPLDLLATDVPVLEAAEAAGWSYDHSGYELIRQVTPDWQLAAPTWPDGIRLTGWEADEQLHELIYVKASWTDVKGHLDRTFEDWRRVLDVEARHPEQQVLAWDGDQLVGAALGHTFSDGAGWIGQLAVAKSARRRGLGRALLLEAFGRRVAGGATSLGLGVSAENPRALELYLDIGLTIDREWRGFVPP